MADYNLGTARGTIEIQYRSGDGPQKAKDDLDGIKKSGMSVEEALGKTARASAVAGTAVAAGLAVAVNSAANFEQRLDAVAAVSGATESQMDKLSDKALQLGKDTAFSATESAQAIEELVKAGLSVEDVLNGAADATVNLAAAGEVSMPEAAAIASNAMNQFNLSAKEMPKVADAIAGAANASAIDVSEFGQSLAQAGAVANLAGVDFEDTATAIALMGNAGIKGSDAGTSLKSMLSRLQPTTKATQTLMEELGIITMDAAKAQEFLRSKGIKPLGNDTDTLTGQLKDYAMELAGVDSFNTEAQAMFRKLGYETQSFSNSFYDANGNLRDLSEVSGVLEKSLEGMTAQQKQATLETLFGSDAIRAAAILADAGAEGFDEMAASMGKVSAADVAAKKMDNLKGRIEELKGSLETVAIQLGTLLIPFITTLVEKLSVAVDWFTELSDGQQKALVAVVALAGGLLLGVAALIKIVQFAKAAQVAFLALRSALLLTAVGANLFAGFAALAAGLTGATTGATLLTKVMNILGKGLRLVALGFRLLAVAIISNPIGLIVAAIIALVAILVVLYKKNETIRNIINAVWASIKSAIGSVVDWLVNNVVPIIQSVWAAIQSGVSAFSDTIIAIFSALMAFWKAAWNTFGPVVTAVFELIGAIIVLHFTVIKAIVMTALNVLLAIFRTAWGTLRSVTSAVWNAIRAVVSAVVTSLARVVGPPLGAVLAFVQGAWRAIRNVTVSIWEGLKSIVSRSIDGMLSVIRGIKDRIMAPFAGAATWLFDAGKKIIQGLVDGIESMVKRATDGVKKVTGAISKFVPGSPVREGPLKVINGGYAGGKIVEMLADGITGNEEDALRAMARLSDNLASTIEPTISGAVEVSTSPSAADSARFAASSAPAPGAGLVGLTLTGTTELVDGKAYIKGVVSEVQDSDETFERAMDRLNPSRSN